MTEQPTPTARVRADADDREPDAAHDRARRRAEKKLGFYKHAAAFVVANAVMIGLDVGLSPDDLWFYWPLGGWGLGLLLHGWSVFSSTRPSKLKENMIAREREREREAAATIEKDGPEGE